MCVVSVDPSFPSPKPSIDIKPKGFLLLTIIMTEENAMPAIVSHYLLAERVRTALKENRPQLALNPVAFTWGASGPDIFFCHRLMPHQRGRSLRAIATEMHNRPAHILLNYLVSYARHHKSDLLMSYALGFVTHYAFDSVAHPFILYSAEVMSYHHPEKHASICHNEIEASLDTLFLWKERRQSISSFPLQSAAPLCPSVNMAIAKALQSYLLYAFDKRVYLSEIVQAQKDWSHSLSSLYDRTGLKYHVIRSGERLIGLPPLLSPLFRRDVPDLTGDPANLQHNPWFAAQQKAEHTDSFFDLADQSELLSLQLIANLLSGHPLTADHCPFSFSGH